MALSWKRYTLLEVSSRHHFWSQLQTHRLIKVLGHEHRSVGPNRYAYTLR